VSTIARFAAAHPVATHTPRADSRLVGTPIATGTDPIPSGGGRGAAMATDAPRRTDAGVARLAGFVGGIPALEDEVELFRATGFYQVFSVTPCLRGESAFDGAWLSRKMANQSLQDLLGRPLGFPETPFLNCVCFGGLQYPTLYFGVGTCAPLAQFAISLLLFGC